MDESTQITGRFRAAAGGRVGGEIWRSELLGEAFPIPGEQCSQRVSRQLVDRPQRALTTTITGGRAIIAALDLDRFDMFELRRSQEHTDAGYRQAAAEIASALQDQTGLLREAAA